VSGKEKMSQTIIAVMIVGLAAAWLGRRFCQTFLAAWRGELDKGGSCGSCTRNPAVSEPDMIQLSRHKPNRP